MTDWQRLDPRMLLVHPVREVVRFLPVLLGVAVAGTASDGVTWELLGVVLPVVVGVLRYLTTSYRIADGRVELRRGLVSRSVLSARLDRVRTVDLTASPVHRLLGLTTLRIGTGSAASDDDEGLDLDALRSDRATQLRAELLQGSAAARPAPPGAEGGAVGAARPAPALTLDLSWVRYAPLTGTGAVIFAGLLGVLGQAVSVAGGLRIDAERLETELAGLVGWLVLAGLLLGALASYVVLSAVGYLVVNWGFSLTRAEGSWHVGRGLLTTRETSVDEQRVAGVAVVEPWPLRLARAARVSAIVTGLGPASDSAALTPPAPRAVAARVGALVLGTARPVVGPLLGHGPAARRRRLVRALGPALLLVAVGVLAVVLLGAPGWLLAPGLLALPLAVVLAVDRARSLGHALTDGHVVARSGSAVRRREALATGHVIGWNLRSTWFQRRAGLTTLTATTAGGRQRVTVLDVPEGMAEELAARATPGLLDPFLTALGEVSRT